MTEPDALRRMQCLALAVEVAKFNSAEGGTNILAVAQAYWQWLNETNQTETPPTASDDIPF